MKKLLTLFLCACFTFAVVGRGGGEEKKTEKKETKTETKKEETK